MMAVRNAAKRTTGKTTPARFELSELETLTGKSKQYVQRALAELTRANLVEFSASEITVNSQPIDGTQELLDEAVGVRGEV